MKTLVGALSIFFAFLIDWGVIRGSIFGFPFSFTALAVLFWFWHMKLLPRAWLALAAGILLDTFSLLPFGTYTLSFFVFAFLTEFLKVFFVNFNQGRTEWMRLPLMCIGFFGIRIFLSFGLSFV